MESEWRRNVMTLGLNYYTYGTDPPREGQVLIARMLDEPVPTWLTNFRTGPDTTAAVQILSGETAPYHTVLRSVPSRYQHFPYRYRVEPDRPP